MKLLHILMLAAAAGTLVYSLHPRHWRRPEVNTLDSAQIIQVLVRKERKS